MRISSINKNDEDDDIYCWTNALDFYIYNILYLNNMNQ